MEKNLNENVVIYDWLSFTTKQHTPEQVIAALGLSECPWSDITGAHGYMDRKYFGNISIHYWLCWRGNRSKEIWMDAVSCCTTCAGKQYYY